MDNGCRGLVLKSWCIEGERREDKKGRMRKKVGAWTRGERIVEQCYLCTTAGNNSG